MNVYNAVVIASRAVLMLTLCVGIAACPLLRIDDDEPGPDSGILLVNLTSKPLVYLALELEESHLVDPNPRLDVTPEHERFIEEGASELVANASIRGKYEPGDTVRFLLYEVTENEAVLKDALTVTAADLERLDYRVEVRELSHPSSPDH